MASKTPKAKANLDSPATQPARKAPAAKKVEAADKPFAPKKPSKAAAKPVATADGRTFPSAEAEKLFKRLCASFPYETTNDQAHALQRMAGYLVTPTSRTAYVLKGAAGTGKTSLMQTVVEQLEQRETSFVLMAPTGRAAKVLHRTTGRPASTLHSIIYQVEEEQGDLVFRLKVNNDPEDQVYIVDEASMIGEASAEGGTLLPGRSVLRDLLDYVWESGMGRKLILVGDVAQLPPVGAATSPALDEHWLRNRYSLKVAAVHLREVKRQVLESGILRNATHLRQALEEPQAGLPRLEPADDVVLLQCSDDLLETYFQHYSREEPDNVVILTFSNRSAVSINQAIRQRIFAFDFTDPDEPREPPLLVKDDRIMVVKNAYRVQQNNSLGFVDFLANGEQGTVVAVGDEERRYDHQWVDAVLSFPLPNDREVEVEVKVLGSLLASLEPQFKGDESRRLREARMADIRKQVEKLEEAAKSHTPTVDELNAGVATRKFNKGLKIKSLMRQDKYLNALQLKYGYAVTGHKAQGGQWPHVIVVYEPSLRRNEAENGGDTTFLLRWLYTALTRASRKVYLFGFPPELILG